MSHDAGANDASIHGVLAEVVDALAAIDRTPCSPGEQQAAEWVAARLRAAGASEVALERESSWGTFPPTSTALAVLGVLAAASVLARRRAAGALLAAASMLGVVDEAQNGPRIVRRMLRRRRSTVNVVASAAREADHQPEPYTLVVLAHHDAPQTGAIFDQTLQRRLYELAPSLLERGKTPLPQWWVGIAGPLLTIAAALGLGRGLARAGLSLNLLGSVVVADIWRSETVQGANDNLSGVAALVALAQLLREHPPKGVRVLLVSCGAEETLQDGVRAFLARHGEELHAGRTCFVNLDTVGSPHLVMLEAEGPIWMEHYEGPWLREELAACAERLEIPLERGFRARSSTDSVIPSRAGYPTATLVSITDWRMPANYHLPSDIPANLDLDTVASATRLVAELVRQLELGAPAQRP